MIKLINGRGQLGTALHDYIKTIGDQTPDDIEYSIYHTWNIDDQSIHAQLKEIDKLRTYLCCRNSKEIFVFISTLHEKDGPYLSAKMEAESIIRSEVPLYKIYRIPYMIGKGLCKNIVRNKYNPFPGRIEVSTLDYIAMQIVSKLDSDDNLECLHGDLLDVNTLKEALLYDRN